MTTITEPLHAYLKLLRKMYTDLNSYEINFISKPQNKKIRPFEKSILEVATKNTIKFKKFNITTYKWGVFSLLQR